MANAKDITAKIYQAAGLIETGADPHDYDGGLSVLMMMYKDLMNGKFTHGKPPVPPNQAIDELKEITKTEAFKLLVGLPDLLDGHDSVHAIGADEFKLVRNLEARFLDVENMDSEPERPDILKFSLKDTQLDRFLKNNIGEDKDERLKDAHKETSFLDNARSITAPPYNLVPFSDIPPPEVSSHQQDEIFSSIMGRLFNQNTSENGPFDFHQKIKEVETISHGFKTSFQAASLGFQIKSFAYKPSHGTNFPDVHVMVLYDMDSAATYEHEEQINQMLTQAMKTYFKAPNVTVTQDKDAFQKFQESQGIGTARIEYHPMHQAVSFRV